MNTIKAILALSLAVTVAACGSQNTGKEAVDAHDEHEQHHDTVALTLRQMQTVGIKMGGMEWREIGTDISASGQLCLAATGRGAESECRTGGGLYRKHLDY